MPVIKSQNIPCSVIPFSMRDVEDQARGMLLRARQQAEQLLAAAQQEGERLKADARTQGHAEGFSEGKAAGFQAGEKAGHDQAIAAQAEAMKKTLGALTTAVSSLNAQREQLESAGVQDVAQLAIAIARRVTKRQGTIDPEVLAANLQQVMGLVTQASDVRIAFHPDQRQTLEGALAALKLKWPALKHVEMVEDESIARGGCRVFTAQGFVDADLDTQLNRIVHDLMPGDPSA